MHRRVFLKTAAAGVGGLMLPRAVRCAPETRPAAQTGLQPLAAGLLQDWCDGLLRVQIDDPAKPDQHGAFRCPACAALHGRCGDAVYPLMHLARTTGQTRYLDGAVRVVDWMKNVDSPDGAWTNEPHSPDSWKGITAFGSIALGEAVRWHGDLLEPAVKARWLARLRPAGQFICDNFKMDYANINYPVTAAYTLTLLGELFDEPKFRARGREFAHSALNYLSKPNRLLFGEGQPQLRRSAKGLVPVDLGYNVEESLPALVLYGLATKDEEVLGPVTAALAAHLEFMLPDGGWDNSWGTRNYKWTYWGSRTCDGSQTAYALLADRHPAFATAALRNTQLQRACTRDGLLYGGPHFASRGLPPCVHHTFTHGKALATILDRVESWPRAAAAGPLPRETAQGVRTFAELDTTLIARGPWRATVSGYDWLYKKGVFSGMGGALSMLWHRDGGPLFTASLANYLLVEPYNMQPLPGAENFCLTPRVELKSGGQWFANIFAPSATVEPVDGTGRIECAVAARLVDAGQKDPSSGALRCALRYGFSDEVVTVSAQIDGSVPGAATCALVLPLIAARGETVRRVSATGYEVSQGRGIVAIAASAPLEIVATGAERVFNLVPGFHAVPFTIAVAPGSAGRVECSIRYRPA